MKFISEDTFDFYIYTNPYLDRGRRGESGGRAEKSEERCNNLHFPYYFELAQKNMTNS